MFTTVEHASSYQTKQKVSLPCRRLDSFDIIGNRIIIKVDVEGQELEVLKGSEDLFTSNRVVAVYLDGYENPMVKSWLKGYGFYFLNGRTLQKVEGNVFSLLAVKIPLNQD